MSAQARYIIAKYVPEILRNEPRNFGVIVWSPEKLDARFSGETGGGGVDGRKIPEWVKSKTSYKEWVHYLRNCIAHGAVEIKGKVVRSDVPDFIDALKDVSNANYVLADTGSVLDELEADDVSSLTNYLFDLLVEGESDEQIARNAYDLERACNRIIRSTKIYEDKRFSKDRGVFCKITKGVNEFFQFDYYYGNGDPEWLYKRVPLGTRQLNKHVDSTAWQFEKVVQAGVIERDRGAALIMPSADQRADEQVQRAINVLHTVTRVIDLTAERDKLAEELHALPKRG